jgi:hypothetical protein
VPFHNAVLAACHKRSWYAFPSGETVKKTLEAVGKIDLTSFKPVQVLIGLPVLEELAVFF